MQNEQIEQEFFEAFGIEPELNCVNCTKFNDGESIYGTKGGCYDGSKETKKCYSLYPPTTPEIVLGLEEIIIEHAFAYINMEGRKIIENAPFGYIYKYGLYECHCGISSAHKIGKGKTRIESLLNICIQLKDEIQDQVKALFKC